MIVDRDSEKAADFYLEVSSALNSQSADCLIFVPIFNNLTYLQNTLRQVEHWHGYRVVVIDNGSTYRPLLDFYRDCFQGDEGPVLIKLNENLGPHFPFFDKGFYEIMPRVFVYTDPDLDFGPEVDSSICQTLLHLSNKFEIGKVGLALKISDSELFRDEKFSNGGIPGSIVKWEKRFWKNKIKDQMFPELFLADIDTTFALYNKSFFSPADFYIGIRLAGGFEARHLPWYKTSVVPEFEQAFYRNSSKFSVYSASKEN